MDSVPSKPSPRAGRRAVRPAARATVTPSLPLALLERIRAQDLPQEILEDEDLTVSLPRRLGLKGVVESQIQRYREAVRRNQAVSADEAADLLRLVLRRPDAATILRGAGEDVVRRALGRPTVAPTLLRILPRRVAYAIVRRKVRKVLRRVVGRGRIRVTGRPPVIELADAIAAEVDPSGTACTLYAVVAEEVMFLYTRTRPRVEHTRCQARGEARCQWVYGDPAPAA